jgi:formate dehydrogenase iron-sulfur subunit
MIPAPAILTDVTRCIGCEECVAACKRVNALPLREAAPRPGASPDGLSATRWTTVVRRPGNRFVRKQCRHCAHPACVSVCPVGALQRTPEGPVVYDRSLCMGCRYCMLACPYGIPRYEWDTVAPSVRKCTLCYPHLVSGRLAAPACVTACPTQATIFGTRDALLAEARRRLGAEPGRYLPRIWGERQVGGTAVLYLSDIPLDFLAWADGATLGEDPLPDRTWAALRLVPLEFFGVGALMSGLAWIVRRRRRLAGQRDPGNHRDSKGEDRHAE